MPSDEGMGSHGTTEQDYQKTDISKYKETEDVNPANISLLLIIADIIKAPTGESRRGQ